MTCLFAAWCLPVILLSEMKMSNMWKMMFKLEICGSGQPRVKCWQYLRHTQISVDIRQWMQVDGIRMSGRVLVIAVCCQRLFDPMWVHWFWQLANMSKSTFDILFPENALKYFFGGGQKWNIFNGRVVLVAKLVL